MTKRFLPTLTACRSLAVLLLLSAGCDAAPPATAPAGPRPQALPTIVVPINGTPVTLQVADDEAEREVGLMHTKSMPADHGMVFVFPVERPLAFWMKNTPLDLDIIYVNRTNRVVAVKTMRAYDSKTVPSEEPATFAIELNAGVAAKLKVAAGQRIDLPATLTANVK